jgi:hypothetical protein
MMLRRLTRHSRIRYEAVASEALKGCTLSLASVSRKMGSVSSDSLLASMGEGAL